LGFLLLSIPLALLQLVQHDGTQQQVLLCGLLTLVGTFVGLSVPAVMMEVEDVVQSKERAAPGYFGPGGALAQAFGLYEVAHTAGLVLGALWAAGAIHVGGWGTMGWAMGILTGITALPMLWYAGDRLRDE
jgi:hypothetical protein